MFNGVGTNLSGASDNLGAFPKCGVEVAAESLLMHHKSQHGMGLMDQVPPPPHPPGGLYLLGILLINYDMTPVPGGGVSEGGQQTGPTSRFTFFTATCGTQL